MDYSAIVPYALAIAKGATDRVAALERQAELAADAFAVLEARVTALEPTT